MAKQTDKQKLEHYRQNIAKQYKDKLDALEKENKLLKSENEKLKTDNNKLETTNVMLEETVERLKNYLSLSDEQLETLIKDAKTREDLSESLKGMNKLFEKTGGSYFSSMLGL